MLVSDEEVSKQVKDTLARLKLRVQREVQSSDNNDAFDAKMGEQMEREQWRSRQSRLRVCGKVSYDDGVSVTGHHGVYELGLMVSINQRLDAEALVIVAEEFGLRLSLSRLKFRGYRMMM